MSLSATTRRKVKIALADKPAGDELCDAVDLLAGLSAAEIAFLDGAVSGTLTASKAIVVNAASQVDNLGVADDGGLKLGTDADIIVRHRAAALNANTALTGAIVGTPVTPALAANSVIVANITADGDVLIATQTGGNTQAGLFIDASAGTVDLLGAGVRQARVSATALTLGLAGTTLGQLILSGNTSGAITIKSLAAAGTYSLTLPPDDGDSGEQLQTDGSGVLTWEAAGSLRSVKNVIAEVSDRADAVLQRLLGAGVYEFTYREGGRPTTGDYETHYVGVMADEMPEVMHHGGRIFSPVNAFGQMLLAMKAMAAKIDRLEKQLAAA